MLKYEQVAKELTERAADTLGEGKTLLDYVADWLSSGRTIVQLAEEIGHSRDTVRRVLYASDEKEAVDERLRAARAAGAALLVEEAMQIVDGAEQNRDAIAKVNAQLSIRTWAASRHNRKQYGDQKSADVTINIGQLHLDSLRRANAQMRPADVSNALPAASEPVIVEIEAAE